MHIPHHLIAHLADLSGALDEPGTDLQAVLAVLIDDLVIAVPSFLGLRIAIPTDRHDWDGLILTLLPPELTRAVAASLLLPLDALGITDRGGSVVFYASRPGAFVDLAADTRFAYGLDGQVTLDEHLPPSDEPAAPSAIVGLTEARAINQAIGVLLGRGHTQHAARSVLQRRADEEGVALHVAARELLDTTLNAGPPRDPRA